MKRTHSLWLGMATAVGLLALAIAPARAQQPVAANVGTIHGRIINPTGQPQGGGTVNLSTDGGTTYKYTFPVDDTGSFTGQAAPGT